LFQAPALAERSLDFAVSGKVRNQDAAYQLMIPLSMPGTRELAWNFVKTHWDQVQAQLTTDTGASLVSATGSFCSADARDDVQSFFAAHKVPASDSALKHAIERINGCIEFRRLQEPKFKEWLAAQPQS
jgi:aminopeptidase N